MASSANGLNNQPSLLPPIMTGWLRSTSSPHWLLDPTHLFLFISQTKAAPNTEETTPQLHLCLHQIPTSILWNGTIWPWMLRRQRDWSLLYSTLTTNKAQVQNPCRGWWGEQRKSSRCCPDPGCCSQQRTSHTHTVDCSPWSPLGGGSAAPEPEQLRSHNSFMSQAIPAAPSVTGLLSHFFYIFWCTIIAASHDILNSSFRLYRV